MNRYVHAISNRLSLRVPQRKSLEILATISAEVSLEPDANLEETLETIQTHYSRVKSFEREFPSLCFALATGVGKTRLMGAFISYLYLEHGMKHFFVLAPNLTIYNKLIKDFTPNTPKYVFKGISEFAVNPPQVITGDTYDQVGSLLDRQEAVQINIFNISKINSEVRGGKSPKIRKLSEYLGQSYFDYLAGLPDLVILMDESHRYRASAGVRAINELKPVLGLELTATPFVETSKGAIGFQNVVYDYPLGRAMEDGYVKEPAVVTRKNFNATSLSSEELEQIKLQDGIRLHESTKVDLETYARTAQLEIVKPFVLVIARDTTHARKLMELIKSDNFFGGRYKEKVIQVDSSLKGAKEEAMIGRLLRVEDRNEPTEIVIHVNMLKEGWDVTNLYTIVPLRAANARILIEQSIGRGLRLPYGKRTGVAAIDRLNIVAHDKFQEIVDEANRPDSPIRLKQHILSDEEIQTEREVLVSSTNLKNALFVGEEPLLEYPTDPVKELSVSTATKESREVAGITYRVIQEMGTDPEMVPTTKHLNTPEVKKEVERRVQKKLIGTQLKLDGIVALPDVTKIVEEVATFVMEQTIDIPRIVILPKGEVKFVFESFTLDTSSINYQAPDQDLWVHYLRTSESESVATADGGHHEKRFEDHIVRRLIDFPDIDYASTSDLLYDLSEQVVHHVSSYLSEEDTGKVIRYFERQIAQTVHAQMREHFHVESDKGFEVKVTRGYDELRDSVLTHDKNRLLDIRQTPENKSQIRRYLYQGFQRCLYPRQKFESNSERRMAIILDRESEKWFKPAHGQFQIFYQTLTGSNQYNPDFVAEMKDWILMVEVKRDDQIEEKTVIAKKKAAMEYCSNASDYCLLHNGKPWKYVLVPSSLITENIGLNMLVDQFTITPKY